VAFEGTKPIIVADSLEQIVAEPPDPEIVGNASIDTNTSSEISEHPPEVTVLLK